ncbi:MAG: MerR family transcriptional regulator [Bryobacterales bacterium]|jgi:DNA-binding transcriptional MerR regulator|nr:MerR family transcriptional regulator [Bryobacterales bacterium]
MAVSAVARSRSADDKADHRISPPTEIPDKLMFRIGEVSRIVGVETYVLRYWETEFPQLAPKKSGSGHRMYRRKEVEQLLLIRQLLYERQYTIKGARNYLKDLARQRVRSMDPLEAACHDGSSLAPTNEADRELVMAVSADPIASSVKSSPQSVNVGALREELRNILTLLG